MAAPSEGENNRGKLGCIEIYFRRSISIQGRLPHRRGRRHPHPIPSRALACCVARSRSQFALPHSSRIDGRRKLSDPRNSADHTFYSSRDEWCSWRRELSSVTPATLEFVNRDHCSRGRSRLVIARRDRTESNGSDVLENVIHLLEAKKINIFACVYRR